MIMTQNPKAMTNSAHVPDHVESPFRFRDQRSSANPPQRHREHKGRTEKRMSSTLNKLSYEVIGAALEVHRTLGPGLLESSYRKSLYRELSIRHIPFQRELPLPLNYKGLRLDCGYRMDAVVARQIVVEVKSVVALAPIHEAQLLTYLKIGGYRLGLLINFNVLVLKDGIRRKIVGYDN
jgi:GxxExxY protein